MRRLPLLFVVLLGACAPASFDDVTGTPTTDPTLAAPRPIAPLSVTWVNTARPRFRWELPPAASGAIVELSRSRDFSTPRTFDVASGTELVVPKDLEAGFWFWRLRSRGRNVEGSLASPTWEVLVRGPSARGASDVPVGGILDVDGDGRPDLNVVAMIADEPRAPYPGLFTLLAKQGDYELSPQTAIFESAAQPDPVLGRALDVDGDGYSDFSAAQVWKNPADETDPDVWGFVTIKHGGPDGTDRAKDQRQTMVRTMRLFSLPTLEAAGDVNDDGHGDLLVSVAGSTYFALGSPFGAESLSIVANHDPALPPRALAGGCDLDGDGISDIAFGGAIPGFPIAYARGSRDRFEPPSRIPLADSAGAAALVAGDFDGDAKEEIAFATTRAGVPAVCVYSPGSTPVNDRACWTATAAAESLAAADLDVDGKDEILVASGSAIVVLTHEGDGFSGEGSRFVAREIPGAFAPRIAVIHPGRPGNARWAVYRADYLELDVFTGTKLTPALTLKGMPAFTKFGSALR